MRSVILNIDLTNDVDVSLHFDSYRKELAYHLKDGAKCFVSVLHIGMDMTFIDIYRQFLPNGPYLNSTNCN